MNSERNTARQEPRGEQLLFDWTQVENRAANQPVMPQADQAADVSHAIDSAAVPCLSTTAQSKVKESRPSEASASHEAEPIDGDGYRPNHPWHYLGDGDNAPPVPFDDIPPAEDYDGSVERDLPKPAAKRIIKARQLLDAERGGLEQARTRYEDVITRGVEALSRYDREIAYGGNDELARAGTLALLYNQIAWRKGRIACLEQLQSRPLTRSR
ncbi:MAG: hypothetical protein KF841_15280 [Phycisphaerae bacterium]|nr:hypothetical protein [Phycisphaerae bacterium]